MAFADEIIKARRKVTPYLRFARLLNQEPWAGPDERLYASKYDSSGPLGAKAHVEAFGSFSRSIANALFSLEIPGLNVTLMDPDGDWRLYANEPYDTLLWKWIHLLLRVHDDNHDPLDATVALGLIQSVGYPSGRKVTLNASVTAPEILSGRVPKRVITRDDWPDAPMESVGKAVPIIYGRVSNSVTTEASLELAEVPSCCPEWTPPPGSQTRNADYPALRWSDYFTNRQGTEVYPDNSYYSYPNAWNTGAGPGTDGWLAQNYVNVGDATIVENANETGDGPALYTRQGYGEVMRPVGPSWFVGSYPDPSNPLVAHPGETWDTETPMGGRTPGQYGSAGFRRKMVSADGQPGLGGPGGPQNEDLPVAIELYAYRGAPTYILSLGTWDNGVDSVARHLWLYVNGVVGRRNGAYPFFTGPSTTNADDQLDEGSGGTYWSTAAMQNILLTDEWQTIEMKWKLSSIVDPYNADGASTDFGKLGTATVANDGWVVVRVDGQVVLYLQDIQFYHDALVDAPWASIIYWHGVAFRPQGYCSCLYVTDRALFCDEMEPVEVESPVPCTENAVTTENAGALPTILVESTETTSTSLQRINGIDTPTQNNDEAPQNVVIYTGPVGEGDILAGRPTWYRVTGVKNGQETSWSGIQYAYSDQPYYVRLEWDPPPQGEMDSYRVYQMISDSLSLHESMGEGFPREETYWVKEIPGWQEPGGRNEAGPSNHWAEFGSIGEGTAYNAAQQVTNISYDNVYVVAGHAGDESQGEKGVLDVFAPLPGLREHLGGLNLLTGEKEPISYEETQARMTRLVPGDDYWVEVVDKPSGRFTVIHITRRLRDINTCAFPPVTVNFAGITENADGSGGLITDGIQIFKHFLLNWVFNSYATGDWFTDVAHSPGIVDVASFDVASAVGADHMGSPLQGAVAILSQADARQLITEAITTFGLNFFYRNAGDTGWGAWAVSITDTRWSNAGPWPQFTPADDMLEESFQTAITMELLANVVNYKAGPNLNGGSLNGWIISGTLTDGNSTARAWGEIPKDLVLPWTRDQATAVHVAGQYLDLCSFPAVVGSFQVKGRGVVQQPADFIQIAHPDAPGLGWATRVALITGHDFDIDNGVITLRFLTTPSMIE